jgi:molybdopterin/thiamine biosynthesis adenylyltransferase
METYARQVVLKEIGYEGQLRLRNGRACILGVGGLGAPIALKLTGMGIGTLRIVDRDIVCRSDLHRQYLYDTDSIGKPKVEVAVSKLGRLNPDVHIEPFAESLHSRNVEDLLEGMDVVIDGLDRPEIRYVVNRACVRLHIPYVFGGALGTSGNVTTIVPGKTMCLECFMPGLKDEHAPKCGVVGVHPSVLGMITSIQVFEAVRVITGREPILQNRLLHIDLDELKFHTVDIDKWDQCPVCGENSSSHPEPVTDKFFEEACSRDGRRTLFITPGDRVAVDLEELARVIDKMGFSIKTRGDLGITFDLSPHEVASVLKSGTMIVQISPKVGDEPKPRVLQTYRTLLVESLHLPARIVPEI